MTRYVYFGTYTFTNSDHRKEGIHVYRMDPDSGILTRASSVESGPNPSYLAFHPSQRYLYSVNEEVEGGVSAFSIDAHHGSLMRLNSQPTHGSAPCYLSVDPTGKWLLVANYGSGCLTVLPIQADGTLEPASDVVQHQGSGVNPQRQEGAHAHSVVFDPQGQFLLAADLGLDQILVYRLDRAMGKLIPNNPPFTRSEPGAGPRHMVFHPEYHIMFAANELNSTVTAYRWDQGKGTLTPIQSQSILPPGVQVENSAADIHIDPYGKYLYVSNRGHDSLAVFAVEAQSGKMSPAGHVSTGGECPRNFALDPDGKFLIAANQNSDTVVVFKIQPENGLPVQTGQVISMPMPVCVKFLDL